MSGLKIFFPGAPYRRIAMLFVPTTRAWRVLEAQAMFAGKAATETIDLVRLNLLGMRVAFGERWTRGYAFLTEAALHLRGPNDPNPDARSGSEVGLDLSLARVDRVTWRPGWRGGTVIIDVLDTTIRLRCWRSRHLATTLERRRRNVAPSPDDA